MKQYVAVCALGMALVVPRAAADDSAIVQDFKGEFNTIVDALLKATQGDGLLQAARARARGGNRLSAEYKKSLNESREEFFKAVAKFIKAAPLYAGSQQDKVLTLNSLKELMKNIIVVLSKEPDKLSNSQLRAKLAGVRSSADATRDRQKTLIDAGIKFDANKIRRQLLLEIANRLSSLITELQGIFQ